MYRIANGDIESRLIQRQLMFDEARNMIEGVEQASNGIRVVRHDPVQAAAILSAQDPDLVLDIQSGTGFLGRYENEPSRITSLDVMRSLQNSTRSLIASLESIQSRGRSLMSIAQERIAQAEALRQEGNRFLQEAQNALARNNFDTARNRLLQSGERYDASLAIQDSPALRQERDTRLVSLGAEISRIENEIIVRDVRSLVTNARNTYFMGNFERAEELLIQAQARWQTTNAEPDQEITNWLTVVRGALSLRSGRTIPPTAPLYAEMSQLLSDAKGIYTEGVRLINAGQRRTGLDKFAEARRKIHDVRLMFPVNQEAGILELRIDQVIDPSAFADSFQRRFTEAVAGTKRRSVESFADLQNLAEINPRYPGMSAALSQAEIDMGYRLPPPNPRDLARSDELVLLARRIIDGNVQGQFPIAVEQLNQALTLNPNNAQAMVQKDRVQTLMGGGGSVVLDSDSEREYQRAVQALQQGNGIVALSIVQQLLQNPQNRNSTRILDLQRRIESSL